MTSFNGVPWRKRAECGAGRFHPDLWSTLDVAGLAVHICRSHCPVYEMCRQFGLPLAGFVVAGQLYSPGRAPEPVDAPPRTEGCVLCRRGATPWTPPPDVLGRLETTEVVLADCGTRSAYERHRRHGEPIDEPCRQANLAYHRKRDAERRARKRDALARAS